MSVVSLPAEEFDFGDFDLEEYIAVNRSRGSEIDVHEIAPRRWRANFRTKRLQVADVGKWKAFRSSLRSNTNQFYAYDPELRYPADYLAGGFTGVLRHDTSAFDGTGVIDAISAYSITMSTLPSTFQFRAGDRIGLIDGTNRAIHEVQADAIASAGVATVAIEPEVITSIYDSSSTFNLDHPVCIMIMMPGTWSAPRGLEGGTIGFGGIQKLV